ncbi:MAG TPA: hypothetical protein PL185_06780 [Flavobacteriales bacterium]|nr:hypothetical protein [Flavobacteriales bacterium]
MKRIFVSLSICFLLASCNKNEVIIGPPECLNDQITEFIKGACPYGNYVDKYKFQNEIVYVLTPGSCGADMQTLVINEECQQLGTLGGITGNTQINGVDFYANAQYIEGIWYG